MALLDYLTTERRPAAGGMLLNYRAVRGTAPAASVLPPPAGPTPVVSSFPVQYSGLRAFFQAAVKELCLVAEADAPAGMGGVLKVNKGGTNYAVYLVETGDANATPVRIQTSTGTKAVRIKT